MFCQKYQKTCILLTVVTAMVVVARACSAAPAQPRSTSGKTKIFTVFLGTGYDTARLYYGRSVLTT